MYRVVPYGQEPLLDEAFGKDPSNLGPSFLDLISLYNVTMDSSSREEGRR